MHPYFIVFIAALLLYYVFVSWIRRSRRTLPPSPWGLPLIGHLHLLGGQLPHKAFQSISLKFGPIVRIRLGMIPAILVSGHDVAKEVFTVHDATFSSRPYYVVGDYLEYGFVALGSSSYGEHYRSLRKLCVTELFTSRCINSFAWVRERELSHLLELVLDCHGRSEAVDLRSFLTTFTFNAITQIVCSKRYYGCDVDPDAIEFKDLTSQIVEIAFKPCLSNFVPWYLRWLDWRIPQYKKLQADADKFLDKIVKEHRATSRDVRDFTDMLLSHFGEGTQADTNTKATLLDLLTAGTETSTVSSEWTLAAVMDNPRVMKKAQEELDEVIGRSRMVTESDLPKLNYLQVIIKETMRRYPTSVMIIPRMSNYDTQVGGYYVPKGTTLLVNTWALGMDASVWNNPDEFIPERFIGSSIDFKGQDFELIPFGSGRRRCPGMLLGVRTVELLVANLLHGFNWTFETSTPPSMEAVFPSVCLLKTPLRALATPRLPREAYTKEVAYMKI